MKKVIFILALALYGIASFAQETSEVKKEEVKAEEPKEEFKPHGKVYANLFTNFHFSKEGDESGFEFELGRAYLGYKYQLTENFAGNVKLDVGNEDFLLNDGGDTTTETKIFMFIKSANVQYNKGAFELNFGLIDLYQFKYTEKQWGYRYVFKTFQDNNKYGSSADLGINVKYKFIDQLNVDFTVSNGEGYKSLQVDDNFKYALGINVIPVKNLLIRLYGDINDNPTNVNQITLSGFAGYNMKEKFRIGAEYDYQINHKNSTDKNLSGLAAYATVYLTKKMNVFGRFDLLSSNVIDATVNPDSWNIKKDGKRLIGGIEYSPIKYVNLALNYQGFIPDLDGADVKHGIYLNTEIKF